MSSAAYFFSLLLLLIEFLDEIVFGVREAAWPLIRDDLSLTYAQVGLLLGLPGILGNLLEIPLGVLGDVWSRRAIVLAGGLCFATALLLIGSATSFTMLLLGFILFYPASGAFVALGQATLMDLDPARHEQSMARWNLAGSLGNVAGPLMLGGAALLTLGWRSLFLLFALLTLGMVFLVARHPFPRPDDTPEETGLHVGLRGVWAALRQRKILRWLLLLECADLMGDILLGFLALYFVDVVGVSATTAGLAVALWVGVGLIGDALLIPLLARVQGLSYLRLSAAVTMLLYIAFLLVPSLGLKLILMTLLALANSGWYPILQGQLYAAMPGRSGTVMTLGSIAGIVAGFLPLGLGRVAEQGSLSLTMGLLLIGPVVLLVALPRPEPTASAECPTP
ncbi:MAG: MFS transporter [Ardenticatenales bacterium]|nr:MFS transporter [Ardenticatenales bacterium]